MEFTYRVGWKHICKAVHSVYDFYQGQEILNAKALINLFANIWIVWNWQCIDNLMRCVLWRLLDYY